MYTDFYGLKEKPFSLTPDPQFFYAGPGHRRALAYLEYGLKEKKGIIIISGEIGAGKTTLINVLLDQLQKRDKIARIWNPVLDLIDLYKAILQGFNLPCDSDSKKELQDIFYRFLLRQYSQNSLSLVVIDEAQNMTLKALEEIRMLSNLETPKEKLIQIILVGQPEIRRKLALTKLKQLKQRVAVIYHLDALSSEETPLYIQHRLKVAGCPRGDIFTPEAIEYIYHASDGIPRIINLLCDAALLAGYAEREKKIEPDIISQVQQSLGVFSVLPEPIGVSEKESVPSHPETPEPKKMEPEDIIKPEELALVGDNLDKGSKKVPGLFRSWKTIFLTLAFFFLIFISWGKLEDPLQTVKNSFPLIYLKLQGISQKIISLVPVKQPTSRKDPGHDPKEIQGMAGSSGPGEKSIPELSYPETLDGSQDSFPSAPTIEALPDLEITEPIPQTPDTKRLATNDNQSTTDTAPPIIPEESSGTIAYVNTFALTVRSGKGTNYKPIGWIKAGTPITILDDTDTWYHIMTPAGWVGYVNGIYLTKIE